MVDVPRVPGFGDLVDTPTVGSLFSGIGGLDLGLERAGMRVIWQSEIDDYASRVLAKHWPGVPNYGDIKRIDWRRVERPTVICGGYPCQPFSQAGRRKGEEDPRHLWPWVREAISELRPDYAILENVRGHLSLGGTTVIADLAALGYDAEWRIVSAASVGANHRRDRIIILAHPNDAGRKKQWVAKSDEEKFSATQYGGNRVANTDSGRFVHTRATIYPTDGRFPTFAEPAERSWWETEPQVGRVANGVPRRVDRLRGLGNAVVPQVAEVIGRLVMADSSRHNH